MDCCNYMQYKFPYYGPYHQYYENFTYESEYYGHQYQNYYGNGPCYQQYWPCATPFPDYVYNPKEARMRKAMREATRDHSLGGIHLQSRGGRPMQSWQNPPEEQLMMNPPSELHPTICGYSSLNGAYMHQMRPYSKTLQTGPSSSWVSNSSFYSQGHSMEPLQHQQGEVWQNYQETNSCATNYIPDAQVHSFPSGSADLIPSISRGNCQTEKDPFPNNYQIQANRHLTENVALNVTQSKMSASSIDKKGSNLPLPMHSPLCCENDENSQQYAQIFNGSQNDPAVPEQNRFGGQKESRTEEDFCLHYLTITFDAPSIGCDSLLDFPNVTDIICLDILDDKNIFFTPDNKDPSNKLTTSYKQVTIELLNENEMFYDCPDNLENVGSEIVVHSVKENM